MLHYDHGQSRIMRHRANAEEQSEMSDEQLEIERQQVSNSHERLQRKFDEVKARNKVQPKEEMEISQPGDSEEKEADEIAEKVTGGGEKEIATFTPPPADNNIHWKHDDKLMAMTEGGDLEATDRLQAKLESSKGAGQALDDKTKGEMESSMNADLSDVRIHTGPNAHEMAEGINAKAFTHGQDIYFKNGNFGTGSKGGKNLLAHELVHTQQQKGGVQRKGGLETIPESQRSQMDVETQRTSIFSHLPQMFDYTLRDDYSTKLVGTPDTLENEIKSTDFVELINISTVLRFGFQKMAFFLLGGNQPFLSNGESMTLMIDFQNLGINQDTLKTFAETSEDPERKLAAAEIQTKRAYRITVYENAGKKKVMIEGLGEAKAKGNADKGKQLADKLQFDFVDNPPAEDLGADEQKHTWKPDEKLKVSAAFSILPEAVLTSFKKLKLYRIEEAQEDIEKRRAADATPDPNDSPGTFTNASYNQGKHVLKIYTSAFKDSMTLYGDAAAGFSTEFERTIVHELGHAEDYNPMRQSFSETFPQYAEVQKSEADLNAAIKKGDEIVIARDNAANEHDKGLPVFNLALATFDNTAILQASNARSKGISDAGAAVEALREAMFNKCNELLNNKKKEESDALYQKYKEMLLLFTGGTTSDNIQLLGLNNAFEATSEQIQPMVSYLNSIVDVDETLNSQAIAAFLVIPALVAAYQNTVKFRNDVVKWATMETTGQPMVPQDINQEMAQILLAEGQVYLTLGENRKKLNDDIVKNNTHVQELENNLTQTRNALVEERGKTVSVSGYQQDATGKVKPENELVDSDFIKAAQKDFGQGQAINKPTWYADESRAEFFAETFSLYFTDPQRMSLLRPHLYSYFENKYKHYGNQYSTKD